MSEEIEGEEQNQYQKQKRSRRRIDDKLKLECHNKY